MTWSRGEFFLWGLAILLVHGECTEIFTIRDKSLGRERRSTNEDQQCTHKDMVAARYTYGTSILTEFQEDEMMDYMKLCSDTVAANKNCYLGAEAVFNGHQDGNVEIIFIHDDFNECAELLMHNGSSQHHIRVVSEQHVLKDTSLNWRGENLTVVASGPFFPFLEAYTGIPLPPIYRLSTCNMDEYNYRAVMSSGPIFGLRKMAIKRGNIPRPEKSFLCSVNNVSDAILTHANIITPREEHRIVESLESCQNGTEKFCVFGIRATVDAYRKNQLMVVALDTNTMIITKEFVNSVTGDLHFRHEEFQSNISDHDLIIGGVVYYHRRCLPTVSYLSELDKKHTLVIKLSTCHRFFDNAGFQKFYSGIAGILLHDVRVNPTTPVPIARNPKFIVGNGTAELCDCPEIDLLNAVAKPTDNDQASKLSMMYHGTSDSSNMAVLLSLLTIILILIGVISLQIIILIKLLKRVTDSEIEL